MLVCVYVCTHTAQLERALEFLQRICRFKLMLKRQTGGGSTLKTLCNLEITFFVSFALVLGRRLKLDPIYDSVSVFFCLCCTPPTPTPSLPRSPRAYKSFYSRRVVFVSGNLCQT